MADANPFAWILEKPRKRLDREFYERAQSFEDIDDTMWRYLLSLVPVRGCSYAARVKHMIQGLSPELNRYYLVRNFHGEWGSGGMEGIFLDDVDWKEWVPLAIAAHRDLRAIRSAELIERIVACIPQSESARSTAELDQLSSVLKAYDTPWERLTDAENVFESIWQDIRRDCTPYVHPTTPEKSRH